MRIKFTQTFFITFKHKECCDFVSSFCLKTYYQFLQLSCSMDTSSVLPTSSQTTYQGQNVTIKAVSLTSKPISFLFRNIVSFEYSQAYSLVSITKFDTLMSANFADNIITLLSNFFCLMFKLYLQILLFSYNQTFSKMSSPPRIIACKIYFFKSAVWFQNYTIYYSWWLEGSAFQKIFASHGLYFEHNVPFLVMFILNLLAYLLQHL